MFSLSLYYYIRITCITKDLKTKFVVRLVLSKIVNITIMILKCKTHWSLRFIDDNAHKHLIFARNIFTLNADKILCVCSPAYITPEVSYKKLTQPRRVWYYKNIKTKKLYIS